MISPRFPAELASGGMRPVTTHHMSVPKILIPSMNVDLGGELVNFCTTATARTSLPLQHARVVLHRPLVHSPRSMKKRTICSRAASPIVASLGPSAQCMAASGGVLEVPAKLCEMQSRMRILLAFHGESTLTLLSESSDKREPRLDIPGEYRCPGECSRAWKYVCLYACTSSTGSAELCGWTSGCSIGTYA